MIIPVLREGEYPEIDSARVSGDATMLLVTVPTTAVGAYEFIVKEIAPGTTLSERIGAKVTITK